jgi:hypothetical protein
VETWRFRLVVCLLVFLIVVSFSRSPTDPLAQESPQLGHTQGLAEHAVMRASEGASSSPLIESSSETLDPGASLGSVAIGATEFLDDFEDGDFDGWHAVALGCATEWSVITIGTSYWLHHKYTGSTTGHTDPNQFVCDKCTVDLAGDFTFEFATRIDSPIVNFGGFLLTLDEQSGYKCGFLTHDSQIDPNENRFFLFEQYVSYAVTEGASYHVKVTKVGTHYSGYINGTPVLEVDNAATGVFEFSVYSRGYYGRACETSYDWISASGTGVRLLQPSAFSDDFEDGDFDGWHALTASNKNEWSVIPIQGRLWATHHYVGSSTGHTDTNWLVCDLFSVDLSKDFDLEFLMRCDYANTEFGGGLLWLDEASGPGYTGRLSSETNHFYLLNQSAVFAVSQGMHYRVKIVKTSQHYLGYVNGSLVLSVDSAVTGICKFGFRSRGSYGRACDASFDWMSITIKEENTTTTLPPGIPGFPLVAVILGAVAAVSLAVWTRRRAKQPSERRLRVN